MRGNVTPFQWLKKCPLSFKLDWNLMQTLRSLKLDKINRRNLRTWCACQEARASSQCRSEEETQRGLKKREYDELRRDYMRNKA